MRNCIFFALLCFGLLPVHAQKIIGKHIPFSTRGFVSMNFQISDSVRIITWKKEEVYIKSSIDINDNQDNDAYKMVFDEAGSTINVSGHLESNEDPCRCHYDARIYHVVYIPENADFSVETINANITIAGETAEIRARSISGNIFFRKEG